MSGYIVNPVDGLAWNQEAVGSNPTTQTLSFTQTHVRWNGAKSTKLCYGGSTPPRGSKFRWVLSSTERILCYEREDRGSTPLGPTKFYNRSCSRHRSPKPRSLNNDGWLTIGFDSYNSCQVSIEGYPRGSRGLPAKKLGW
jgi:hypothetical protein